MTDRRVVGKTADVAAAPMAGAGIEGVMKRVLISPEQGWDGWVMRLFDIDPGGHTPKHAHDWPHINFVASGRGELHLDGEDWQGRQHVPPPSHPLDLSADNDDARAIAALTRGE
jgi:quercetin dioxygenase-like cupin family protein